VAISIAGDCWYLFIAVDFEITIISLVFQEKSNQSNSFVVIKVDC